ncbi:MAG: hypothetical protein IAF94_13305 [Pirellulaceae bacterium]|nr:hypothetical protein [Pirellulaceae bacterium]
MKIRPIITWLQYAFANAVIVVLLPLLALQGMPPIDWAWSWLRRTAPEAAEDVDLEDFEPPEPNPVANAIDSWTGPLLDITGTWTGPWWMFAPYPDNTNHRIRAEIAYYDGKRVEWRSPDWPELSCWQRFWLSRDLEMMDQLGGARDNSADKMALWSAYADYLSRQERTNLEPGGAPQSVRFIVEVAIIDNPHARGWQTMSQLYPRGNERVALIRKYPLPLELRGKQAASSGGAP